MKGTTYLLDNLNINDYKIEENKSKVAGYASVDRDTRSLSHLQHPEPSGSFSQDFSLPIQDMMNSVVL